MNPLDKVALPPLVVTTTSFAPAVVRVGTLQVRPVEKPTTTDVQALPPTVTVVLPAINELPTIVTEAWPVPVPELGVMLVMVGAGGMTGAPVAYVWPAGRLASRPHFQAR